MGSKLLENVRKQTKKKDKNRKDEAEFDVMYSSGFLAIDYLNGTTIHVESPERNFTYNSCGIVDGSTNTTIGRTGSGKSTLTTEICGEILRPFIDAGYDAMLFYDDIEGSLPQVRKEFLLNLSKEEINEHVVIRNTGITTENVFNRIKNIHDYKLQNRSDYEYDTGLYDTYGERIFKLIPTIYFIDSLPLLLPENIIEDEELGGNMDASSVAKSNTFMFKKMAQLCKEANIILFTINHILDDIQMGFIPKAAQISGLKDKERLPGGKAALYLANNMFRVDDSLTLKADKDYGIDGSVITFSLVKTRTNASKKSIPLIFNKTEGRYDKILSLFHLVKQKGRVMGAGSASYFEGAPDVKFTQKTFKSKLESSPELQEAFSKECFDILKTLLSDTKRVPAEEVSVVKNINDIISNMSNNN